MTILRVHGPDKGTRLTNGTSLTFSLANTPTEGNVLIACIALANDEGSVSSISQTGVTWTKQVSQGYNGVYDVDAEIWAGIVGSGASTSLTITITMSEVIIANVCEYSGLAITDFLDKYNFTYGSYTQTQLTGTTATTTQNDELWIGCISVQKDSSSNDSSTPTNGFTLIDGIHLPRNTCCYLEKIVSSKGAASSGVTTTYPNYLAYAGCIATFKKAKASPTKIKTELIDTILKKLGVPKTCSVDTSIISPKTTQYGMDAILTSIPNPPSTGETLVLTNSNGMLWCKPLKWKESQACTPAIRPLPLASSEYLDSDTYVLKPRTIEVELRLSDREKKVFESIYNYASVSGVSQYTDVYLYYDYGESDAYTWHYIAWIHDKKYNWEYSREDGRYVRWWYLTFTLDVLDFTGSSDTLPQYPLSTVTVDGETFDFVVNFERNDQHPPAKPEWVNQTEAVDSYIWNECVLDVAYTCRMTNSEKYYIDESLRAHTKVVWEDYIHNLFSISGGTNGVWISSVEAEYDSTNWMKPWKVTVLIQANNSEIESRSGNLLVDSLAYPSGTNHLGVLYLDELPNPQGLPSSQSVDVGVHILYFFLPTQALSFHDWEITGGVIVLDEQDFNRESILTVLITDDCTIYPRYDMAVSPNCDLTLDSYESPCIVSSGEIAIETFLGDTVEEMVNGDFETGDFTGWTSYIGEITTSNPHAGTYCAQSAYGDGNYYLDIVQTFADPIPVTEISSFTVYIRCTESDNVWVTFYTDDEGGSYNFTDTTSSWKLYDLKAIMASLGVSGNLTDVEFYNNDATISTAIDDVSLQAATPIEMVVNGDFETGTSSGWSFTNSSIVTFPTHGGTYAARISSGTGYILQTFNPFVPLDLIVSGGFWVLNVIGTGNIHLVYGDGSSQDIAIGESANWYWVNLYNNISGIHEDIVSIKIEAGSSMDMYVDDVSFKVGAYTLPHVSTVTIGTPYEIIYFPDGYVFDHWEITGDISIDDINANPTHITVNSGSTGAVTAILKGTQEFITNGGFETGDFTGWTSYGALIKSDQQHTGTYSAWLGNGCNAWIEQVLVTPEDVSKVVSFGVWIRPQSDGTTPAIYIEYVVGGSTQVLPTCPSNIWTYIDLKPYLEAGRTISGIKILMLTDINWDTYVDDISLIGWT